MRDEILRLLELEGIKPEDADEIILAEISDELDLSLEAVMRYLAPPLA